MSSTPVKVLRNKEELKKILENANHPKLVVLEFMSQWSEPCKYMLKVVQDIASRSTSYADFYSLDIDEFKEFARGNKVEALPTFLLLKNGSVQHRIVGIKKEELENSIKTYEGVSGSVSQQAVPHTQTAASEVSSGSQQPLVEPHRFHPPRRSYARRARRSQQPSPPLQSALFERLFRPYTPGFIFPWRHILR